MQTQELSCFKLACINMMYFVIQEAAELYSFD